MSTKRLTTMIVDPEGPLSASICLIGQAPGADEDSSGKPFVGAAGQFLNRCLRQIGINRSETLITNIFQQRPPRNDVGYYFQDKGKRRLTWEGEEHLRKLQGFLEELLRRREEGKGGPNVLVAFGREALLFLTGKERITKWRGSVLPCTLVPGFKVYPCFHPSFINRMMNEVEERLYGEKKKQQQNAFPLFLIDLKRVKEQAEFPEIRRPARTFLTSLCFNELLGMLNRLASFKQGMVSVDIETVPGKSGPLVWMIGFALTPEEGFVVPVLKNWKPAWVLEEEVQLWVAISRVFLNPNIKKIFQGGMYDLSILGKAYGLRVAKDTYEDTMLCHHASYPYLKKALETLCSIYTWEPYYKDEGKVWGGKRGSDEGEGRYNCKDTTVTREILPITQRNARELDTWEGYQRTLSIIPSLLGMTIRGVKIDTEKKKVLAKEFGEKAEENKEIFFEVTGDSSINLNSSQQLRRVLYGYFGLPPQINHKTKKVTTGRDALEKLKKHARGDAKKALESLLEYKKFAKLTSTYTSMEVEGDGRVRTSYSIISTYRLNSSTSPFGGGGNLQNIPVRTEEGRAIRTLFVPDKGKIMMARDYCQAEAMVVAWEAEDLAEIERFLRGEDTHWAKAKELFGIPSSVPYNPKALFTSPLVKQEHTLKEYRNLGKICRHAGNYGQGPKMLQTSLAREGFDVPFGICKQFIERFKATSPFTMRWQRKIREELKATRTLVSSYRRKRQFMGRLNDNLFRAGYAFSPQNTVGEMTEVSIQKIWEELPYVDILLNSHDEVIFQTAPENWERAARDTKKLMEQTLLINGRKLTIPTSLKKGPSWGELEEVEG